MYICHMFEHFVAILCVIKMQYDCAQEFLFAGDKNKLEVVITLIYMEIAFELCEK